MTRVAYLTGTYPRATDTFIQREVAAHREAGWDVVTFAVNRPDDDALASDAQRVERARTDYLLADRGALLRDAVAGARRSPVRTLRALLLAWRTRRRGLHGTVWQLAHLVEAAALAERMRRREVGHVHDHQGGSSATVAMLSAVLGPHTFSMTLHGPGIFFEARETQLATKVRRAALCVCISRFARAQAALFAPERLEDIRIVHCGVDPDAYPVRSHTGPVRRLLSVARLDIVKGYGVLLEALAGLSDIELLLVGDGPDRKALEARAADLGVADRVTFAGYRAPAEVATMLGTADVFVLPSFAEGVPVSLMEAMAAGVPVVATQVGGVSELVTDGESGHVVPPGDADALRTAIASLADPLVRTRMGAAGRRTVEQDFDSRGQAALMRDHLHAVLG